MSLNATPAGERVHIGIFGRRNAGKSSLINALTGQNLAVVSPVPGTTTDPVQKSMELLPLGPVVLIDTPGLDDEGELGRLRVEKAMQVLGKIDLAVVAADSALGLSQQDQAVMGELQGRGVPFVVAMTKCDLLPQRKKGDEKSGQGPAVVWVSAASGENIPLLRELLAGLSPREAEHPIIADLLSPGDVVVLVTPIDQSAPKGRLILPQQQTIRDVLDAGALPLVTRDTELSRALGALQSPPRLVITDSQAFHRVAQLVPRAVPLTSFSILMARRKGNLAGAIKGVRALEGLQDGDRVLIAEGCTHHRQCGDIGTQKLPRWIAQHTGRQLEFFFCSGTEFPDDLGQYALVVHCGGCMLSGGEMRSREQKALRQGVAMSNYGIVIAAVTGILERSVEMLPEI